MSKRRECPYCGSLKVREEADKDDVLFYSGGVKIFGKKMVCTDCKREWKV